MSINLFFQICKEFFDGMYLQDFPENETNIGLDDQEKGFEELLERTNEDKCMCNLCYIIKQMLSLIDIKNIKSE